MPGYGRVDGSQRVVVERRVVHEIRGVPVDVQREPVDIDGAAALVLVVADPGDFRRGVEADVALERDVAVVGLRERLIVAGDVHVLTGVCSSAGPPPDPAAATASNVAYRIELLHDTGQPPAKL